MTEQKKHSPPHRFSLQERIEMIKIFYSGNSLKQTAKIFSDRHPDCPHVPTTSGITRLVRKFETTGSVLDRRIPGRPKVPKDKADLKQALLCRCEWPGCDYVSSKKCMSRHKLVHKTERDFACDWPNCEKRFKSSHSLKNHLRIHYQDKRFACSWPGCQYRCVDSGNIRKHKKIHEKHFKGFIKNFDHNQECQTTEDKQDEQQTEAETSTDMKFEIALTEIVN